MDLNRIPAGFVPRAAAFVAVAIVATVGITWAALHGIPHVKALPPTTPAKPPKPIVVPDVRREAFVFAKGTLEDAGFAWKVRGKVHGFAANTVVQQVPAAGTKVYDTGAPLVVLTLERNAHYSQKGVAEDASPYEATAIDPAETISVAPETAAPATAPATAPKTTTPKTTAPKTTPAATPAKTAAPAKTTKPAKTAAGLPAWPATRPAAFVAAGAKKEPLDEMPLVNRAILLDRWLDAHPKLTAANAHHWLYQNEWIVVGAKFGWWHGAEALQKLIAVDRRAEQLWGIGAQSENLATQALHYVETKSKLSS
jgi:hypothetical protein